MKRLTRDSMPPRPRKPPAFPDNALCRFGSDSPAHRSQNRRASHRPRSGFTLTELLVTITIVGILAALVFGGMHTARERARIERTKATITKLHNIVMDKYESYATRRVPINTTGQTFQQAARLRLQAIRDLMRMEMPECPMDVTSGPGVTGLTRPALSQAYLIRYNAANPTSQYNAAEIFYMWVTMSNPEARGQFAENEVADTDGDGWPEFVDAWGNPIMFLRWAPGFISANGADSQLQSGDPVNDHDPLDPYRVDAQAFRLVPLIYSAGLDGIYDIEIQQGYDLANPYASSKGMPKDLENVSRTASGPANGSLDHYDNIHNHRLEVR